MQLPGQPSADMLAQKGINPGIHGARGLFCLLVVFYHIQNGGLPTITLPTFVTEGLDSFRFGVELFFAISGFVIFGTMQRSRTPMAFLTNRMTRILPVLWVVVIVYLPLGIVDGEARIIELFDRPLSFAAAFVGNLFALGPVLPVPVFYGVTWTISYEFTFYTLCFAYLACRDHARLDWRWPFILAGLALIMIFPRAMFFICGILVATGLPTGRYWRMAQAFPLFWLIVFLIVWQWAAPPKATPFPMMTEWTFNRQIPAGIIAFAAMTLAIGGIAQSSGRLLNTVLTTPLFLWLGTISYSLYLWHPIILGVVKFAMRQVGLVDVAGDASPLLFLLLALPPSLVVAHISQRTLEVRISGWLRQHIAAPVIVREPL